MGAIASYDSRMSRRASLWDEVRTLVMRDEVPAIELPAATRIVERRAPGRPRTNPVGDRYAHWRMKSPSGFPLRCRNSGCSKPLRKDAVDICCSEGCRELLRRFCEDTLSVLDGTTEATSYPSYWRSDRLRRRASRTRPA